jgi:hypothetical protein
MINKKHYLKHDMLSNIAVIFELIFIVLGVGLLLYVLFKEVL